MAFKLKVRRDSEADIQLRLEMAEAVLKEIARELTNGIRPGGGKPQELIRIEKYFNSILEEKNIPEGK
jgi:hypothetical protein